ncbi:MAG: ATP-binding cassette domain-containing protein [Lachnospiraceae bacterium]
MGKGDSVLQISHVSKNFGKVKALKDISFEIKAGEIFGFIGPNGSGKSTTIRILLGIIKATAGEAYIYGEDVWKQRVSIHEKIAYVPGDVYLWPNLTGGEIIDFLLKLSGQKHSDKTDELIRAFDLDRSKKARTYSKGNRQKVALIAALSMDAQLYLFDEPTSGLDPLNEIIFQERVLALKQEGKSVLLSSHILSEVEKMCDRIAIVRDGRIIETGTLDEMRHLTGTQMYVKTREPLPELTKLTGVHGVRLHTPTEAELSVDAGEIETVLQMLLTRGIDDLKMSPPALEDLFLHYYAQPTDGDEVSPKEA